MLLQGLWVILDWTLSSDTLAGLRSRLRLDVLVFRTLCPCGLRSWCLPNVRILVTCQLIRSFLIRTEQTKIIPVGATAKMAQLRTAPPRWLWHRGLRPCGPGHFGFLHKKPERFHIQTIMWLEVPLLHTDYYVTWSSAVPLPRMEYSLAWTSAYAQGIYWDLKFHNSASANRIVCDLELWNGAIPLPHKENTMVWKLRNSASIQ